MRVQLLGPVRAWRADNEVDLGSPRQRAVLGLLALAGGQPLSRAELIQALWSDRPPPSAANVIQTHIKHLRRILDPHRRPRSPSAVLPSVGDGYALRLGADADAVDVTRFRQLVLTARARAEQEPRQATVLLGEALSLWRGTPFADVPALAAHPKVAALQDEWLAAVTQYGELMIGVGDAAEALPAIEDAAARQPLDEAVQALLVRAYHAAGRPARAFETYHQVRRRLSDELGVDPGPHLTAAHLALLQVPPSVPPAGPQPPAAQLKARVPHPQTPRQLPADVYGFTGRSRELSQLDSLLPPVGEPPATATAAVIAAVSGTPGVGKTALAVHWAHRVSPRFPDGQLYIDMRGHDVNGPLSTGDALTRLLAALGVTGAAVPLDLDERAARWRTAAAGRSMLVLLDNVASVEQVRLLLPGTPSCVVLVTSRDNLGGLVALHGARRLGVDLLPLDESITLLGTLVGRRVAAEPAAAEALAERCARLPLALRVAAELVNSRPHKAIAELVAELADHRRRLELLDLGDGGNVRVVFSWSYQRLPPDSATAFRRLGLHPGPDVDIHGLAALCDVDVATARRAVAPLVRAHLVDRVGDERFAMHELLRVYAVERGTAEEDEDTRTAALGRLFDSVLATCAAAMTILHRTSGAPVPESAGPVLRDPADALAWLDIQRPGLVALCAFADRPEFAPQVGNIAATVWRYLEGGHYTDALTVHTRALHAATIIADRAAQADALTSLGAVHRLLGRYDDAAAHLRRALGLYRTADRPQGAARAMSNLGVVEERLGQHDSAVAHHRDALAKYRLAGDRQGEAATLNNLGAAYSDGSPDLAAECYGQALVLYRSLDDRAGQAIALSNLAIVDNALGRLDAAQRHLRLALALFRELGHRYGEAAVLNNLGDVETALGRYESGSAHQLTSLRLFRELGHRYGESGALNGIGEAVRRAGRPAEALDRHLAALTVAIETGDRDEQARAHDGAGHACQDLDDLAGARAHWEQALVQFTELGQARADAVRSQLAALACGSPAAR